MSEPKFTKGRWEFIHGIEVVSHIPESNEHEVIHICYWQSDNAPKEEQQANARLIAQAPNMYKMLKEARDMIEDLTNIIDNAKSVIFESKRELIQRIDDILARVDGES